MTLEPRQPLRRLEHAGRSVGVLVWVENQGWRSAWRIDSGAWHSLRETRASEEAAADAAYAAAVEHIDTAVPGGRRRRSGTAGSSARGERGAVAPSAAGLPTAQSWSHLHQAWREADEALNRARQAAGELPSRADVEHIARLEATAEEARRAMDRNLSRILRAPRRKPPRATPGTLDDPPPA